MGLAEPLLWPIPLDNHWEDRSADANKALVSSSSFHLPVAVFLMSSPQEHNPRTNKSKQRSLLHRRLAPQRLPSLRITRRSTRQERA